MLQLWLLVNKMQENSEKTIRGATVEPDIAGRAEVLQRGRILDAITCGSSPRL